MAFELSPEHEEFRKVVREFAAEAIDPRVAGPGGRLGEVDRGLRGLPLAEQHRVVPVEVAPVLQQRPGGRRDVGVAALAPDVDPGPIWLI